MGYSKFNSHFLQQKKNISDTFGTEIIAYSVNS